MKISRSMYWREVSGVYLVTPRGNVYFLQDGSPFAYLQHAESSHICDALTADKFTKMTGLPAVTVVRASLITSARI